MKHAVIWVDHKEARVIKLDEEGARYEAEHVKAPVGQHDKGHHHTHAEPKFLEDLAHRLSAFELVLLTGPGDAKEELAAFVQHRHPAWKVKIAAIEPTDHPTDGQLAERGRKVLRAADRMHGVHVR
ncbi:MAG: translational machinery protein [Deltaproteobacteria bacterium]